LDRRGFDRRNGLDAVAKKIILSGPSPGMEPRSLFMMDDTSHRPSIVRNGIVLRMGYFSALKRMRSFRNLILSPNIVRMMKSRTIR
jgi:hypothetical protein